MSPCLLEYLLVGTIFIVFLRGIVFIVLSGLYCIFEWRIESFDYDNVHVFTIVSQRSSVELHRMENYIDDFIRCPVINFAEFIY